MVAAPAPLTGVPGQAARAGLLALSSAYSDDGAPRPPQAARAGAFCRNGLPDPLVGTVGKEPSEVSGMLRDVRLGAAAVVLMIAASGSGAEAFVGSGLLKGPFGVTPAAMCGYSCRNGGRYIPGPPSVCEEEGLSYCGSSRGGASPRREIEEDEEVVRPGGGYGPRGYGSPGFRSEPRWASVCVTARGNCATRSSPPGSPCGCDIPGFGFKRGAVAR